MSNTVMRKKRKKPTSKALKQLINTMDASHMEVANKLIYRLEFIEETLIKLENQIDTDGPVITAVNGNGFKTTLEHPAQKSYNAMIGRYNAMVKTLIDMLPDAAQGEDELEIFLRRDKK